MGFCSACEYNAVGCPVDGEEFAENRNNRKTKETEAERLSWYRDMNLSFLRFLVPFKAFFFKFLISHKEYQECVTRNTEMVE